MLLLLLLLYASPGQVIAMFSAFNFAWPVSLKGMLNTVSASNMNIQLLAPECSLKFDFKDQWAGVAILPVLLCGTLALMGVGMVVVHRVKVAIATLRQWSLPAKPDLTPLEGLAFTILYFLYLQMVKNSITMFHCVSNGGVVRWRGWHSRRVVDFVTVVVVCRVFS